MSKVKLTVSGLTSDIESGLTRKEMSEKYGLPSTQLAKAIQKSGLQGRRAKSVKFELIDDTVEALPNVETIESEGYSNQQANQIVEDYYRG